MQRCGVSTATSNTHVLQVDVQFVLMKKFVEIAINWGLAIRVIASNC